MKTQHIKTFGMQLKLFLKENVYLERKIPNQPVFLVSIVGRLKKRERNREKELRRQYQIQ